MYFAGFVDKVDGLFVYCVSQCVDKVYLLSVCILQFVDKVYFLSVCIL